MFGRYFGPSFESGGDYDNSAQMKPLREVKRYRADNGGKAAESGYTVVARRTPYGMPGDMAPIEQVERQQEMMDEFNASIPDDC